MRSPARSEALVTACRDVRLVLQLEVVPRRSGPAEPVQLLVATASTRRPPAVSARSLSCTACDVGADRARTASACTNAKRALRMTMTTIAADSSGIPASSARPAPTHSSSARRWSAGGRTSPTGSREAVRAGRWPVALEAEEHIGGGQPGSLGGRSGSGRSSGRGRGRHGSTLVPRPPVDQRPKVGPDQDLRLCCHGRRQAHGGCHPRPDAQGEERRHGY